MASGEFVELVERFSRQAADAPGPRNEDWRNLLDRYEPEYDRARKRFREGYYRKLAQYLLSDQYRPWPSSITWRHVGTPDDTNERKKLGPVIALFREWHFIEDAEGVEMYQRLEESIPYLRKLLE